MIYLLLIPIVLFFINRKNFLYIFSAIFLILALSKVYKTKEYKEVKVNDKDIIFLIDTTYSMSCNDLKPNRLEYAKKEVKKVIKKLKHNVWVFSFAKKVKLLRNPLIDINSLKPIKTHTDIQMAINRVKYFSDSKKIIVVVSDGGDKKLKGDFIFWGFATKKGAKIPGFNAISKLNIIGDRFFNYNEGDKLLKYLTKNLTSTKKVEIYKDNSYYFIIVAFILFLAGIIYERVMFVLLFFIVVPNSLKANDFLGCFYSYIGATSLAMKEFKNSNSDFGKMKEAIYLMKEHKYKESIQVLNRVKGYDKEKNFDKMLNYIKLKNYKRAYEIAYYLKNKYEDKRIDKIYSKLLEYNKNNLSSKIYGIESKNSKNHNNKRGDIIYQKEEMW